MGPSTSDGGGRFAETNTATVSATGISTMVSTTTSHRVFFFMVLSTTRVVFTMTCVVYLCKGRQRARVCFPDRCVLRLPLLRQGSRVYVPLADEAFDQPAAHSGAMMTMDKLSRFIALIAAWLPGWALAADTVSQTARPAGNVGA